MVWVRVDKSLVPKKEIITKSLADNIDETQNAVTKGSLKRGQSTRKNHLVPYILILLDISSCSFETLKKEGDK